MLKTLTQTLNPHKEAKQKPVVLFGFDDAENERSLEMGENLVNPEPASTNLSAKGSIEFNKEPSNIIHIESFRKTSTHLDALSDQVKEIGGDVGGKIIDFTRSTPGAIKDLFVEDFMGHYKESSKQKKAEGDPSKPEAEEERKKIINFQEARQYIEATQEDKIRLKEKTSEELMQLALRMGITKEELADLEGLAHENAEILNHKLAIVTGAAKKEKTIKAKNNAQKQAKIISFTAKKASMNSNLDPNKAQEGGGATSTMKAA